MLDDVGEVVQKEKFKVSVEERETGSVPPKVRTDVFRNGVSRVSGGYFSLSERNASLLDREMTESRRSKTVEGRKRK